jgi:hypothetical protein
MRTFTIVSALGAVAITLHGCGGGGDSPAPGPAPGPAPKDCANKQVDFVTQSVDGTATGDLTLDLKITGGPPVIAPILAKPITSKLTGSFTLKFDLEQFQASLISTDKLQIGVAGLDLPVDVTAKVVFDAAKKELVLYADADISLMGQKHSIKNCTALTIAEVPPLKNLTQDFDALKKGLQDVFSCNGNDGKYDDWRSPPIPAPISEMVDANVDLKMDKDYLWGEIDLDLTKLDIDQKIPLPPLPEPIGNMTIDSIKGNAGLTVTVSKAAKGGPAAADLDYSGWGITCIPLPAAKDLKDLKSVIFTHLMQARVQGVVAALAAAAGEKAKLVTV